MRIHHNINSFLKLVIFCVCVYSFYMLLIYSAQNRESTSISLRQQIRKIQSRALTKSMGRGFTNFTYRVFHLDLKGAPPKLDYLRELLYLLAAHGCDCILIEYEDMFPYSKELVNISARNSYTKKEIQKILSWTRNLKMEVIPLVQTFGHLEHALKLKEWKHLREVSNDPSVLCPNDSKRPLQLVMKMLEQVVSLHQGIKYLHLGGAEVSQIGLCKECFHFAPRELYADYMTRVASAVHNLYPNLSLIIWDDMLRNWDPSLLESHPLVDKIELMISDNDNALPALVWFWYIKTFKRIWVATAFKGAELPTSDLPNLHLRYHNTKTWLAKIHNPNVPQIAGFVITGRSRFDHFAVLCELLPSSIPSLLLNLIAISKAHTYKSHEKQILIWHEALRCPSSKIISEKVMEDQTAIMNCMFPNADMYRTIIQYNNLKIKTESLYNIMTNHEPWLTPYNVKHNFTNPWLIVQDYFTFKLHPQLVTIKKFKNKVQTILSNYVDAYTINEWTEQRIEPLQEKLESIERTIKKLFAVSTWQRKPIL